MNIKSFVFISLLFVNSGWAQESDLFKLWPDSTLAKANTGEAADYLGPEEKQAIYYINLCRINPSLFESTILKDYLKDKDVKKDKEVKELIHDLQMSGSKHILQPNVLLTNMARDHATDMGKTGRTGHNSSNGTSFHDRMSRASAVFKGVNENCNYGLETGLDIVIDLLIDRDVPNAGHRKNILDPEMRYIGVAIEPHSKWRFNCVQDFAGEKL